MPFTLQAERSADQPVVRQANCPTSQLAGFPTGQSAGQPENRQTDKQAQQPVGRYADRQTDRQDRLPTGQQVINDIKREERMKKEPLFIAFSTQKGGAGKTTLTVLMASYLYYVKGYDVAVVDCDYPQFSIKDMRERDLKNIERNPYLRKLAYDQFRHIGKRAYPIVGSRPDKAMEAVKPFIESATPPDFIFFDLTGTVNNLDLIRTVATMDYIFCPIAADRFIMESSLKYASIINDTLVTTGKSNIKGIRLLWNMVDKREKTDLYDIYDKVIAGMGLEVLHTSLPDSKRFRKEGSEEGDRPFFRSTLLPPDKVLAKGSGIEALAEEILSIVKR